MGISDVISFECDALNNNFKYGVSMSLISNEFYNNNDCDSLIFGQGIDLETYIVYIEANANIFYDNVLNVGIFDLKNAQLSFTESSIYNHSRVVSGTVVEITASNITTNLTTMLYLNDSRDDNSVYGSRFRFENCKFIDSDNAFEIYLQVQDAFDFINCRFEDAAVNAFIGTQHNDTSLAIDKYQFEFLKCHFYNYYDRLAFSLDSNEQKWFANVSMNIIDIYDNDNNRLDSSSALFGIYGNNRNVIKQSEFIMDDVSILRSSDVLAIVEESSVNNDDGRVVLNSFSLTNFVISESIGTILYHSFPREPMTHISMIDSVWENNVQYIPRVSNSVNLIVIEEDGSGCSQLPVSLDDTTQATHFEMINGDFMDNEFEASMINLYCALVDISNSSFFNNENNGNGSSPGGCIYMESSDLFVNISNFEACTVPDYGGTIYGLSDSTLNIYNSNFLNNKIVSNDGGCMALYDSSLYCENCNFYNMSADVNGGAIYAISDGSTDGGSSDTIDDIILYNNNFDEMYANAGNGGSICVINEINLNIVNSNFSNSVSVLGDGGSIYMNLDSYLNMSEIYVESSNSGNNGGFLYVYESDMIYIVDFDCVECFGGNNGGDMYFGLKNSNNVYLYNYASYNSGAVNYGALIYAFALDTLSSQVPYISIINLDVPLTDTGNFSMAIFDVDIIGNDWTVSSAQTVDSFLYWQHSSQLSVNDSRLYSIEINESSFELLPSRVLTLYNLSNGDRFLLKNVDFVNNDYTTIDITFLEALLGDNAKIFMDTVSWSDHDSSVSLDPLIQSLSQNGCDLTTPPSIEIIDSKMYDNSLRSLIEYECSPLELIRFNASNNFMSEINPMIIQSVWADILIYDSSFGGNSHPILSNTETTTLNFTDNIIFLHSYSMFVLEPHATNNVSTLFNNVNISDSVAYDAFGLTRIEGDAYNSENSRILYNNVVFLNNNGTIITTILTSSDVSGISDTI